MAGETCVFLTLGVLFVLLRTESLITKQTCFFFRLIYCSEMYKCLHEFFSKTVPDTSLHEISDLIYAIKVLDVETTFMLTAVEKLTLQ